MGCPAECNSDSSETIRSESNIKENDKECKRIASSNKEISDLSETDRSESTLKEINKECKRIVPSSKEILRNTSIDSRQDVKIHLDNISLRVDEISSKLDVSIANQMKLIAFLLPHEREMIRPPNLPALPLKCINDFWKFEKYLKDAGNMSAMIKYISCYGTDLDETKATMKIMKKLMYNCLAKNINFKGIDPNSTKIPLEKCYLWDLIQGVVMFNKKENCDIDKIKKACQNWLKQASNRKQETID